MCPLVDLFDLLLLHIVFLTYRGPGGLFCFHLRQFPHIQMNESIIEMNDPFMARSGDTGCGWWSYQYKMGGDQGHCSIPSSAQDVPTQRAIQTHMSILPRLIHPDLLTSKIFLSLKNFYLYAHHLPEFILVHMDVLNYTEVMNCLP